MIEHEHAARLYEICELALGVLTEAESIVYGGLQGDSREAIGKAHSQGVVDILCHLRASLVAEYPELDTREHEGPPDTLLDANEQLAADRLTAEQIQRIDDALMSDCVRRPRKVARIVSTAWMLLRDDLASVPLGFYAQRVKVLVDAGKLDSRGNLDHMGFSEVRLARDPLDDVTDAPVTVDADALAALKAFRERRKRTDLVEAEPEDEALDLSPNLDRLADRLAQGVTAHPSRRWVLAQFQQSLVPVVHIDDEGRERFGEELRNILRILRIDGDDGLLDFYLDWR